MTSPQRHRRVLTEQEAERHRNRLRQAQSDRDRARLERIRRRNRQAGWLERLRATALFLGIVAFFTWVYWMAIH